MLLASATLLFQKCSSRASLTEKELRWFQPFQSVDTSIFICENGLKDTVVFYGADTVIAKLRNIEQGFSDVTTYQVRYTLTKGSYHQFVFPSKNAEPEPFLSIIDNDNWTKPTMELSFLGSIYDDSFFGKANQHNNPIVHFDNTTAKFKAVNIEEGIKSFEFDLEKGIVMFIDTFDRKWFLKD